MQGSLIWLIDSIRRSQLKGERESMVPECVRLK